MGLPAASEAEMLGVLTRLFYGYYADASDQNPAVFAKKAVVAWDVGGFWNMPSDQDILYMLTANGIPIVVVPFQDTGAEPSVGAVYRLASKYYPAGNANDPSNVPLVFTYQPVPAAFAAINDSAPSDWPEQFDEMVITDLATYLAEKDGRPQDAQAMAGEASKWRALYRRWLVLADVNTVRRFSVPQQVPTPQVQPIGVAGQ